jgi:hypothetical protein
MQLRKNSIFNVLASFFYGFVCLHIKREFIRRKKKKKIKEVYQIRGGREDNKWLCTITSLNPIG